MAWDKTRHFGLIRGPIPDTVSHLFTVVVPVGGEHVRRGVRNRTRGRAGKALNKQPIDSAGVLVVFGSFARRAIK
jgi:hypothetical protein